MQHFTVTTEGQNNLGLREVSERYANEQWLADHMTPDQVILSEIRRPEAGSQSSHSTIEQSRMASNVGHHSVMICSGQ